MARQKTSPIEDIISIASKLPWWGGTSLALVSYLVLHSCASRPIISMTGPGQIGAAAVHSLFTTFAMLGQYVLPFAFGLGALISAVNLAKQKKIYGAVATRPGLAALNEMGWGDFERLVSEFYRRKGFEVTREGGNGPDGGIDLILRQKGDVYLVQCKQWKAYKVGVQPVREFYGVMASRGVAGGYFVTSGQYTDEATKFAQGLNLELIDGQKLRAMIDAAQKPELTRVTAVPGNASTWSSPPADTSPNAQPTTSAVSASPACPICKSPMSKRIARRGSNAGNEFWGCARYPKCNGTRPIKEARTCEDPAPVIPETAIVAPTETRNCPHCGTELVQRKFTSGPKNGLEFLACLPCKKGWPVGGTG